MNVNWYHRFQVLKRVHSNRNVIALTFFYIKFFFLDYLDLQFSFSLSLPLSISPLLTLSLSLSLYIYIYIREMQIINKYICMSTLFIVFTRSHKCTVAAFEKDNITIFPSKDCWKYFTFIFNTKIRFVVQTPWQFLRYSIPMSGLQLWSTVQKSIFKIILNKYTHFIISNRST